MLLQTPCVRYDYITYGFNFIGSGLGACGILVVSPINDLPGGPVKPFLHLVQSPFRLFTLGECPPEMIHFFVEKLRIATHCLALWVRVLITLNFAERWWWLSHCRYWSVWVGFLYTVMDRSPPTSGITMVSNKGMAPSSLLFSTVNWIAGSTLLMCCRKSCLLTSFWMTKVSSTYLCQSLGGAGQY